MSDLKLEEKAKELIEKFAKQPIDVLYHDVEEGSCLVSGNMNLRSAKACASIHCDLMIEELLAIYTKETEMAANYYESLKQIINQQ